MGFKVVDEPAHGEPEILEGELIDEVAEARARKRAKEPRPIHESRPKAEPRPADAPPILHLGAEFLSRAAVGVGRIDPEKGAKIAAGAVVVKAIAEDTDGLLEAGRMLAKKSQDLADKYGPVLKKALTPGLEQRPLVDMHRKTR